MIYYGWNEYDPLDGSATSIDPLRTLALSTRLGDLVFPGSSGRIWRIRYLSALCYLLKHSEPISENSFRENYLRFRKFENAFILAVFLLKSKFKDATNFDAVIGILKANDYVKSNPNQLNLLGDLLANQMNLGPLGIHAVLMRDLELIDDENLLLLLVGEELAHMFEQSLGADSEIFLNSVKSNHIKNLKLTDYDRLTKRMLFEFGGSNKTEKKAVLDRLFKNPIRKQLFDDIAEAHNKHGSDSEKKFIDHLATVKSPLSRRYRLIKAFDDFQIILHYYFDHIRAVEKNMLCFGISDSDKLKHQFDKIKDTAAQKANALIAACNSFLEENDDEKGTIDDIMDQARQIIALHDHFIEFTTYLIDFHQRHQKQKGKAPWIALLPNKKIEVQPSNIYTKSMPNFDDYKVRNLHNYRFSNCLQMIKDLQYGGQT